MTAKAISPVPLGLWNPKDSYDFDAFMRVSGNHYQLAVLIEAVGEEGIEDVSQIMGLPIEQVKNYLIGGPIVSEQASIVLSRVHMLLSVLLYIMNLARIQRPSMKEFWTKGGRYKQFKQIPRWKQVGLREYLL